MHGRYKGRRVTTDLVGVPVLNGILGLPAVLDEGNVAAVTVHVVGDSLESAVGQRHVVLALCVGSSPRLLVTKVVAGVVVQDRVLPVVHGVQLKKGHISQLNQLEKEKEGLAMRDNYK